MMRREQERGLEETRKLRAELMGLENELKDTQESLVEQEKFWRILEQSPYVQAFDNNIVLGFLPYNHYAHAKPDAEVFGCKFKIFWCRRIGSIKKVLEGEATQEHPFFSRELRGRIVQMSLDEDQLGENDLVHIGRPPLFLVL